MHRCLLHPAVPINKKNSYPTAFFLVINTARGNHLPPPADSGDHDNQNKLRLVSLNSLPWTASSSWALRAVAGEKTRPLLNRLKWLSFPSLAPVLGLDLVVTWISIFLALRSRYLDQCLPTYSCHSYYKKDCPGKACNSNKFATKSTAIDHLYLLNLAPFCGKYLKGKKKQHSRRKEGMFPESSAYIVHLWYRKFSFWRKPQSAFLWKSQEKYLIFGSSKETEKAFVACCY